MATELSGRLVMREEVEAFLDRRFGEDLRLREIKALGVVDDQGIKGFGYGKPLMLRFEHGGEESTVVLSTMAGDDYGHQEYWDRAAELMFQHATSGQLEKHARPWLLGYIDEDGRMVAVERPREFFVMRPMVEGEEYFLHLDRIRSAGLQPSDLELARSFARWLARVHGHRRSAPAVYERRVRGLIGSSDCIFGLIDGYPGSYAPFPAERFVALEQRLVEWRWKLKRHTDRLCMVHGDFHPWNVLVRPDGDFTVLDRSRGAWGEAADDVASMACNYLLYSIMDRGELGGDFETLLRAFWEEYLARTGDELMLELIAPFFVFRALVIASPEWYPGHPPEVRARLFAFLETILEAERFDFARVNDYLAGRA